MLFDKTRNTNTSERKKCSSADELQREIQRTTNLTSAAACGWWRCGAWRCTSPPRTATPSSCWRCPAEAAPSPRLVSAPWRRISPFKFSKERLFVGDLPAACASLSADHLSEEVKGTACNRINRPGATGEEKTVPPLLFPSNQRRRI